MCVRNNVNRVIIGCFYVIMVIRVAVNLCIYDFVYILYDSLYIYYII